MKKIDIEIKISSNDMAKFNLYVMYRKITGMLTLIIGLASFVMAIISFTNGNFKNGGGFMLVAILFDIYFPYTLLKRGKQFVERNEMFQKPFRYSLDMDGVEVCQDEQKDKLLWENCIKVVERKNVIYLFTGINTALIIPKGQINNKLHDVKTIIKDNMPPQKTRTLKI